MANFNPETLLAYITIAGTLMYWLYTVFVRPQRDNIDAIKQDVSDIKSDVRTMEKRISDGFAASVADRRALETRIARVEASDKGAHKRIDVIERRLDEMEHGSHD